jgi:hypothetical protein
MSTWHATESGFDQWIHYAQTKQTTFEAHGTLQDQMNAVTRDMQNCTNGHSRTRRVVMLSKRGSLCPKPQHLSHSAWRAAHASKTRAMRNAGVTVLTD